MPWEVGWHTALNFVALLTAFVQWYSVPDPAAVLHWLLVALSLGIAQTATMIGQGYQRQVEEARVDALAASEAKSEFLSSMSRCQSQKRRCARAARIV